MSGTCFHGLAADDCLICRTLPATASGRGGPSPLRAPAHPAQRRSIGLHLTGVVLGVVVIGAIAWLVAGVVFAVLHLLEIVVVAGAAGWAGYRLGHYRGRRR